MVIRLSVVAASNGFRSNIPYFALYGRLVKPFERLRPGWRIPLVATGPLNIFTDCYFNSQFVKVVACRPHLWLSFP